MSISAGVPVVTIDGPSGSGKGTVSRRLAESLQWHMLDSGAVYRALACAMLNAGKTESHVDDAVQIARELPLAFRHDAIYLGTEDVTVSIRSESCGSLASKIAVHQEVRGALIDLQRSFAKPPGLVADGRDMGTILFPGAFLKIYLDATSEERAKRRYLQLKGSGFGVNLAELEAQIVARDERDKQRATAPLKPAEDAIVIDTTNLGITEVVERLADLVVQRLS